MAEIEPQVVRMEDSEADFEKLKRETEVKAPAKVDAAQLGAGEVVLRTGIGNVTGKVLTNIDTHFWAGKPWTGFPDLNPGYIYYLLQRGTLPEGVKWGFSYADGTDSTARKWVAAFDTAAQKVYCEAGPIGEVDWDVVLVKLDDSGNESSYVDPILGGKIFARIDGLEAIAYLG